MESDFEDGRWCVTIRWRGPRPTPKEVGLLWQFTALRSRPLPEALESLQNASEWKEDRLFTESAQRLREQAEARGFRVEVTPHLPVPKLTPPGSGVTHYCVQFRPSFDEPGYVLVTLGPEGDSVAIVSKTSSETVVLPTERGLRFLEEVAALDPLGIPDLPLGGMDGISLRCRIQQDTGSRTFSAWSPDARRAPRQHGFVLALYQLASDLAREPATVRFLEPLFGYLQAGLPVKRLDGPPLRIRVFGRLSVSQEEALESLFASIPPEEPVLMDLSGLESMGALLYPSFARFHARPGRTVWWVNAPASLHLDAVGVPPERLYPDLESALAALGGHRP
ncbi:MAG TPA: hypothetical protein VE153_30640 [Myxococcus sp.]|nr:hypothetical protein [Myxococcus sp.]